MRILKLLKWISITVCIATTGTIYASDNITPETIPGASIANSNILFMKRFHGLLLEYSKRAHQCSRPFVFDTEIVQYNEMDKTVNPPVLTGPIHEQWKVTACGKKFLFFLGIAPSNENQQDIMIATMSREVDW